MHTAFSRPCMPSSESQILLTSLLSSSPYTGLKSMNVYNIRFSLTYTYKSTTTSQPSYLRHCFLFNLFVTFRSSSVAILACPPTHSSLKIANHSFWYAYTVPYLWNQLADSFRKPLDTQPSPHSPHSSSSSMSSHSLSITVSL